MASDVVPQIVCREDGHVAVCPSCSQEVEVVVTHEPDSYGRFALKAHSDEAGRPVVDEWVAAERAVYDMSAFDRHYAEEHG